MEMRTTEQRTEHMHAIYLFSLSNHLILVGVTLELEPISGTLCTRQPTLDTYRSASTDWKWPPRP
ncbi:hypothetical protein AMELA_G00202720 [Ameiurus melas]|uniref:Uncharacterized protein n=1 Tax=Ameiurus melas TaxID=219545 RepID=A0A7J6A2L9_AMEME|nr:hypothetical protein AMELA_G00202720 [Ameiurus melas]